MEATLDEQQESLKKRQKLTRAAGWILALDALGLTVCRIFISLLTKTDLFAGLAPEQAELVTEVIFDVLVQIGFCFGSAYLVSTIYLKADFKQFLALSNVRKPRLSACLLGVAIGLLAPCLSSLINLLYMSALTGQGVSLPSTGGMVLPAEFSVWYFLAYAVLTAVFPAVCEEFLNRGVVLTAVRGMFPQWATVLIGGLIFGLFHQYVYQFAYTAVFGMVITYVTLKTKSIFPAMIIHFTNNFTAVITEFADAYQWNVFSLTGWIASLDNMVVVIMLLLLGTAACLFAVFAIGRMEERAKKKEIIKKLNLNVDPAFVSVAEVGGPLADVVYYKPTFADVVMYAVALFLTVGITLFTLLGFMV